MCLTFAATSRTAERGRLKGWRSDVSGYFAPWATQSTRVCFSEAERGEPLGIAVPLQGGLEDVASTLSMSTLWLREGPHTMTRTLLVQPVLGTPSRFADATDDVRLRPACGVAPP